MSVSCDRCALSLGGSSCSVTLFLYLVRISFAVPIPDYQDSTSAFSSDLKSTSLLNNYQPAVTTALVGKSTNSTANELYVIRAVVYEIGILTDVDNSTNESAERHEEVNISFYDPPHKGNGLLDLSGIPVPQVVSFNSQTSTPDIESGKISEISSKKQASSTEENGWFDSY